MKLCSTNQYHWLVLPPDDLVHFARGDGSLSNR
jgi:hypothetical protein